MKKQTIYRVGMYLLGLLVLALGLCLTTQVALGVSPIISVANTIYSLVDGLTFGDATLIWYATFVLIEIIIHGVTGKKKTIPMDILQLPLSLIFTRFLNVFKAIIPNFATDLSGTVMGSLPVRLIFLAVSILLTGIGAALSLDMRVIPNPGDGIVQAIADAIGKKVGDVKNCVDITCVIISCVSGLLIGGKIYGIHVGTICCMLLVGRVIVFFNKMFLKQLRQNAGLEG